MHVKALAIRNFRRLKDVVIDLASDISIFVGANNSGKTSVGHALQLFSGKGRFSVHDFSAELWTGIIAFGEGQAEAKLPSIEIDVWFEIGPNDVHRVINLLPGLTWAGKLVGMRVSYVPSSPAVTLARYTELRNRMNEAVAKDEQGHPVYDPSPRNLREYLQDRLHDEYELRHFVLDPTRFDAQMVAEEGYEPVQLLARERSGREILSDLVHIDFLNAQRHLSDGPGSSRAEELSRVLSRFYSRNLEKKSEDFNTLRALAESEAALNEHLERVFEPTLKSLATLGYPGLSNPRMMIRSALDPTQIMSGRDGAIIHYAVGSDEGNPNPPTLPDRYNGLGFKNLIYMVVELLDLHAQWMAIEENRPPVHLIFVEEPEAHLHAQLQQAFIRKVMDIIALQGEDKTYYTSQVVVTTHSTHILYERGFKPIRYFRRSRSQGLSTSEVLSLSIFYDNTDHDIRSFLERYLKLAHCDLFFADGVVLVEGNVERLLLPQMIEKVAPRLQATYLTILEIGGAFGHRFKALIEFLGLTALIITDLDSVFGKPEAANDAAAPEVGEQPEGEAAEAAEADVTEQVAEAKGEGEDDEEEEEEEDQEAAGEKPGKTCIAGHLGAATSNQTLIQWLPRCVSVAELWAATAERRTQARTTDKDALVRVAYQGMTEVTWNGQTLSLAGRTLEEAFALENLAWSQHKDRKPLQLRIPKAVDKDLPTLSTLIHKRVQSKGFSKTDFALSVLAEDPKSWTVPHYITEGLSWLESELAPPGPIQQGAPPPVLAEVAAEAQLEPEPEPAAGQAGQP
jgi:predicted ATP-dependent endonuclease of OLD family